MVDRLEFSKAVKKQMFVRAGGPGNLHCEGCGLKLRAWEFEYDHTIEEWERENIQHGLRPPLTADDGKVLGKKCCHQPKTARKAKERAHVNLVYEKNAKMRKPKGRPIPGSKASGFKKKMNGKVEKR